jgi:CheY-like chemotaxis protein
MDDKIDARARLKRFLEDSPATVTAAESAEEAIDLLGSYLSIDPGAVIVTNLKEDSVELLMPRRTYRSSALGTR